MSDSRDLPDGFYNIHFVTPTPLDKYHVKPNGVGKPLILAKPGVLPENWFVKREGDRYTLTLSSSQSDGFSFAGNLPEDGEPVTFDKPRQFVLEYAGSQGPARRYRIIAPFIGPFEWIFCVGVFLSQGPDAELQIHKYILPPATPEDLPVWEFLPVL